MPRAKRKEVTPLDSGFFALDNDEWQWLVYENLADQGGRGMHMLSKRSRALDKVLRHCEQMLKSSSPTERRQFERHTTGQTRVADFAKAIGPIVRPLVIGKTLKDDIVHEVRRIYRVCNTARQAASEKN
jgi:hypothetical protein